MATTTTLSNNTAIDNTGRAGLTIQFNEACSGIVQASNNGTDGWVQKSFQRVSDPALNNDYLGSQSFLSGEVIRLLNDGMTHFRINTLDNGGDDTVSVTYNPFDGAGLLPARLNNDFVTLGGLGDSQLTSGVTLSGDPAQNLTTGRLGTMTVHNVGMWASGFSGGKLVYAGCAGTTGIQMSVLAGTHLADAMAQRWSFCLVSGGTNDIAGAVASATTLANLETIIVGLLSVGTIPIIMGVLPNLVTFGSAHDALNIGFRKLANKYAHYGVIFEDAFAPHAETTGLGIAGHFRDTTHLTAAQNKARGQRLANLILAAHPWIPDAYPPVSDATGKAGLFTNPIFTANSGAVTPTGWAIGGTGHTSAVAAGTIGNDFTSTRGSANATGNTTSNIAVMGASYVYVGEIKMQDAAKNGNSLIGFRDPGFSGLKHAWQWQLEEVPTDDGMIFAVKFAVPAGTSNNYFYFQNAGTAASTMTFLRNELYTA